MNYRIQNHPILEIIDKNKITIKVDGETYTAIEGEPIASTLMAQGIFVHRKTHKTGESRGVFCGIG